MFYVIMLLVLSHCKAQEELSLTYIGYQYKGTQNRSFLNKELILKTDGDTIRMNLRLPYDSIHHNVIDCGLLYNCHLNSAVFFLVRKFYMLRCLFGTLYVDMRCFGVSWVFSKHKIPHPNQWGILKPQRNTVYSRKTSE